MSDSKIEWTEATWNPVRGCRAVSPGCANCYAQAQAGRFSGPGMPYEGLVTLRANGRGFRWNGAFKEVPDMLDAPLRRQKPTTWFVNSMSDLFGEGVSDDYIAAVYGVMAQTPRHTYQVLTKRSSRMRHWYGWLGDVGGSAAVPPGEVCTIEALNHGADVDRVQRRWPLENVWAGVSIESRDYLYRAADLLHVPAALRFLSIEPLLEDLGDISLAGIHWVIVGGESGPGARPFNVRWARRIIEQCQAAHVPVFVKQLGARPYDSPFEEAAPLRGITLKNHKGGDMDEWPDPALRVREMPGGITINKGPNNGRGALGVQAGPMEMRSNGDEVQASQYLDKPTRVSVHPRRERRRGGKYG